MTNVETALIKLFERHRIVFWYDEKRELRQEFEELWLTGVEKLEIKNNEFSLKHLILRGKTNQKFLLYLHGPRPDDLYNWLLDLELANGVFQADQISLWMSEVGLGSEHWVLAQSHPEFFRDASRRAALRLKLDEQDNPTTILMKMLAICIGDGLPHRLDDLLEKLLEDLANAKENSFETVKVCGLDSFLWDMLKRGFGYESTVPGIQDFAIALFQSSYTISLGEKASLNQEALVFMRRWKDSVRYHQAFETLSEKFARILNIEADVAKKPLNLLLEIDYFKLIDQKIISEMVAKVIDNTLPAAECNTIVRRRRITHWFNLYKDLYEAVNYAAQFQAELNQSDFTIQSISDGVQKYAHTWHKLDQLYRKYIFHARASRQVSLLDPLSQRIDNLYSNNYLLKVNHNWQPMVDAVKVWDAAPVNMQRDFFDHFVRQPIQSNKKVAVIISDALRYEIGKELAEQIRTEDRFEAEIEPAVSMLPSYTQLGMAALLPNQTITLNGDATVLVDGHSASGIENRDKILNSAVPESAAIRADYFQKLTREESRALFRNNNVVYIYHNQIDLVGDKRESEERVFEAVEETLEELVDMVKKLANANYTTILVTSDHGFIYQNGPIEESDFVGKGVSGADIQYSDRRFVIGSGLQASQGFKKFITQQLGLQGDLDIVIPKSILRLRLKGSGMHYVHGGATLLEVVIPVIQIHKKRESDVDQVEIDILRSASVTISTGQLVVSFFQDRPVTSKLQERRLKAGIYSQGGELISDEHELIFDYTSDDPRQREMPVRFILSRRADAFNEQEVILKLEEDVPGTSYRQEYKSARYVLRRSFTSDFDF